jgi:hypothetical protein
MKMIKYSNVFQIIDIINDIIENSNDVHEQIGNRFVTIVYLRIKK